MINVIAESYIMSVGAIKNVVVKRVVGAMYMYVYVYRGAFAIIFCA